MMEINEILQRLSSLSEEAKDGKTAEALKEGCKRLEVFLPKSPVGIKKLFFSSDNEVEFAIAACPSCGATCTNDMNYCDGCGRAFDWGIFKKKD